MSNDEFGGEFGGGRVWLLGDNIDTDVLAPGLYMKGPIEVLAQHCLETVEPDFVATVKPGDVIVAGENFGIGSSREQAPEALKLLGIAAVLARSYGGIFYRNALNLGLPALVYEEAPALTAGAPASVDAANGLATIGDKQIQCEPLPDFLLAMVRDGGLVPHLEKRLKNA